MSMTICLQLGKPGSVLAPSGQPSFLGQFNPAEAIRILGWLCCTHIRPRNVGRRARSKMRRRARVRRERWQPNRVSRRLLYLEFGGINYVSRLLGL